MKIAINTNNYAASTSAIQSLPFNSLVKGDMRLVGQTCYRWFALATSGDIIPDDRPIESVGAWRIDDTDLNLKMSAVADNYNFAANSKTDISSIENWNAFGHIFGFDYKRYRDEIKAIVSNVGSGDVDAGFVLLSNNEKSICCYHKIGNQFLRTNHTSFSQMEDDGNAYNVRAMDVRRERHRKAEGMIRNYLPNDSNQLFATEGSTISDVGNAYINYGVEGTITDGIAGIYDWLYNSLALKTYIPEQNLSCEDLADKIWDCIHNGIY